MRIVVAARRRRINRASAQAGGERHPLVEPCGRQYLVDVYRPRSSNLWESAVGLSWQQGPLSAGAIGRFLVPEPLPKKLLYVEPLRRRMRVRFGGSWIADSEHVLLLFEPGRYPVAYFPENDASPHTLERTEHTTQHPDLG